METRSRRVTLSSEERCEEAFKTWLATQEKALEWLDHPDLLTRPDWAHHGWQACWRYLERKAHEEFIEK